MDPKATRTRRIQKVLLSAIPVLAAALFGVKLISARQGVGGPIHLALPHLSPDGRQILAWAPGVLPGSVSGVLMNADGSDQRPANVPRDAAWLPDGRLLAIQGGTRTEPGRLVIMNADGSDSRPIPTGDLNVGAAQVTEGGRRVVLAHLVRDEVRHIGLWTWYSMGIDGAGLTPLKFAIPTELQVSLNVAPSHDGRHIAFLALRLADTQAASGTPTSTLFVMNADGSGVRELTRLRQDAGGLAWSTDDQEIALSDSYTPHPIPSGFVPDANLVSVKLATGAVRVLAPHERRYMDERPCFAPDGQIFFQSNRDGQFDLYRIKPDGSDPQRITR
jgi:Tol biopolymer transport system component